ncbi:Zinc finger and BTB domain-containing protein 43 [Acipenser ruthenus]|nr:Zinc finger and BTB domain-containing protein 43 [Acipenser ruthenus]
MGSQDGEDGASDGVEYQCSRPLYIQPSIMYHKRWIQVKAERFTQEDSDALAATPMTEEPQASDSELTNQAEYRPSNTDSFNIEAGKAAENFDKSQEGRQTYDEQLDFYGASMEEFSKDRVEETLSGPGEDSLKVQGSEESAELPSGIQEETSHSGFTAVVYKLYPCQCGKSFTHKSQRDRHMSMHLGLRPYGCAVCGKKFKMKHHLVGHMKIHTGIKPYECHICGKRFMWRDSFHRHVSSCTKAYQAKKAEQTADIC